MSIYRLCKLTSVVTQRPCRTSRRPREVRAARGGAEPVYDARLEAGLAARALDVADDHRVRNLGHGVGRHPSRPPHLSAG